MGSVIQCQKEPANIKCDIVNTVLYFPLLLWWVGVHCGIYTGSYNVSNISYMNSPPQPFFFIPLSPDSWNSFSRYHFLHLLTCVHILLYHIHPPSPFPHTSLLLLVPDLQPWWYLFYPSILWFCRRKKRTDKTKNMTFWLMIKVAKQGVSLWYFLVCMYHNPNWFSSSNFLHSTLVPFLW
jgi:hypothetical protein